MAQDIAIDTSLLEHVPDMLARPLTPTVSQKEKMAGFEEMQTATEHTTHIKAADGSPASELVPSSILDAVSALNDLQCEMKSKPVVPHLEREAKLTEFDRLTRERVQVHLRKERDEKLDQIISNQYRQDVRQQPVAEEDARLKALKRVKESERVQLRLAEDLRLAEEGLQQKHVEESRLQAADLAEKTKHRVCQHLQELQKRKLAEEKAEQMRLKHKVDTACDVERQAEMTRQAAIARLISFRRRNWHEEEKRAQLEREDREREELRSEQLLEERHRKRYWRIDEAFSGAQLEHHKNKEIPTKRTQIPPKLPKHVMVSRRDSEPSCYGGGVALVDGKLSGAETEADTVCCTVAFSSAANVEANDADVRSVKPTALKAPRRPQRPPVAPTSKKMSRSSSQPPRILSPDEVSARPIAELDRCATPVPDGLLGDAGRCLSTLSVQSDPAPVSGSAPRLRPWKQKTIQVHSTNYHLELLKAGRAASAGGGYAERVRQRASDIESIQKREEDARLNRGCELLNRMQGRGRYANSSRSP